VLKVEGVFVREPETVEAVPRVSASTDDDVLREESEGTMIENAPDSLRLVQAANIRQTLSY
jgi:hypothetical protein